jgi:hypothetical protein
MHVGKTSKFKACFRLIVLAVTIANIVGIIGYDSAQAADWYNSGWLYRKKITLDAASGASNLTNFPVLISFTADADLAARAQDDGEDIIFTRDDGITPLDYEIESVDGSGNLAAWVEIPTLSNSAATDIYMYYGNAAYTDTHDAAATWDSSFEMVQHLEEVSGGANAILDSTANANHGTDANSPVFGAAGEIDGAVTFDGSNDLIQVADSDSLDILTGITLEAWVNTDNNNASYQTILEKRPGSGTYNYYMRLDNGYLRFSFYNASHIALLDSSTKLTQNAWHHVAATYDQSNIRLYVDGVQVASSAQTAAMVANTGALVLGIETYMPTDEKGFDGTIDEVRISSTNRGAGWIATGYINQNNPSGFISPGLEEVPVTVPAVTTAAASSIEETIAMLNGSITATGGENSTQRGFEWDTNSSFTSSSNWTEAGSFGTGAFAYTLPAATLSQGQKYYYRALARNSAGWSQGSAVSFVTKPDSPALFSASANSTSQIDLSWTKGTGANRTLVRGKEGGYPSSVLDGYEVYFNTGTFEYDTGLNSGTTYYYRAWSEVTVDTVSYYSDPVDASAATDPLIPTTIGGRVFTIDKAAVIAPWLAAAVIISLALTWLILHIRKQLPRVLRRR